MIVTIFSYAAIVLYAISIGLGIVILISAWCTLRPGKGVHLAWWHVLAITIALWNWHALFALRVVSDLNLFGATNVLPGVIPTWYLIFATSNLLLADVALWIILKVQRGRRQLQKAAK